ncbi:MAG: 6-bladed beta-propeller [Candidatus Delongbacteria bacterium]|nr:6-bladed beta-propeller [Candidatus Delongbacteria bacterium]
MKFVKLLAMTLFIALIVNCTKKEEVKTYGQYEENGVKITKNNGIPADTSFSIELKEVGFIDLENVEDSLQFVESASGFNFDKDGNLYFIDRKKHRIHKYDKNGNFVTAFGRKGKGPGEFFIPGGFNVRQDTIFVSNWSSLKLIKFDLDGNYLDADKTYKSRDEFASYPVKFGSDYISSSTSNRFDEGTKEEFMINEITLYDSKFDFVKHLYKIEYPFSRDKEQDPYAKGALSAFSDNEVYISEKSKNVYKIDVYDKDGKKLREIRKNYAQLRVSEEKAKKVAEQGAEYGMKWKVVYKNSVNWMLIDKYNRLFVNSSVNEEEEGIYCDVFENGIFQKRVKIEVEEGYFPSFVGDKIVAVNGDNNNIKIYEY